MSTFPDVEIWCREVSGGGSVPPADITVAGFRALFPEFAQNTDAQVQGALDQAVAEVNPGQWAMEMYPYAVYYLAAHYLFLYNKRQAIAGGGSGTPGTGGTAATAISKKVGDVSVSYSESLLLKQLDNPYLLSPYGIWYYEHLLPGMGAIAV